MIILSFHRPPDVYGGWLLETLQEAEVNIDCSDGEAVELIPKGRRP